MSAGGEEAQHLNDRDQGDERPSERLKRRKEKGQGGEARREQLSWKPTEDSAGRRKGHQQCRLLWRVRDWLSNFASVVLTSLLIVSHSLFSQFR